jgi:hypothetical protein
MVPVFGTVRGCEGRVYAPHTLYAVTMALPKNCR